MSRTGEEFHMDSLVLAAAAGRLFQAVTKETIEQFTPGECMAWLVFTNALEVRRFTGEEPVEDAVHLDPIRYLE